MAKDSTIFYQDQIDICKKHFTPEQFGRLMLALFEVEDGKDPEVDDDIAIAFEFMSLQKRIDRKKYEEKCRKNRENGKKGGRPRKDKNPPKPNGFFKNPNDNDNENDNDNKNDDDKARFSDETETDHHHESLLHLGNFGNVDLTEQEHAALKQQYERVPELIDKVSLWLRSAKNPVDDQYALCIKFANNDQWPKRRPREIIEPVRAKDPLDPEEQERIVAEMKDIVNGAFSSG